MRRALLLFVTLLPTCAAKQPLPSKEPPPPAPVPAKATVFVARTGSPELDETRSTREPRARWPAYARRLAELSRAEGADGGPPRLVPLPARPRRLSRMALFGAPLSVGERSVCWAVDGDPARGFSLTVDENANGDLDDDQPRTFPAGEPATLETTISVKTRLGGVDRTIDFPLKVLVDPNGAFTHEATLRHGTLALPGRTVRFAVSGRNGTYAQPWDAVFFDLDGDGKLARARSYSDERFAMNDPFVVFDGVAYRFAVDWDGGSLTLTATPKVLPPRASLRVGAAAPGFIFKDLRGAAVRLEDFRGRPVLLEFWFPGCPGCDLAEPALRRIHARFAQRLALLGVAMHEDPGQLARYVARQRLIWTHAVEPPDGPVQTLYRIGAWPTWFLLDSAGRIVTSGEGVGDEGDLISTIENLIADRAAPRR